MRPPDEVKKEIVRQWLTKAEPNLDEAHEATELARKVRDAVMDRLGKTQ